MRGLTRDCLQEMVARKLLILYGIVTALVVIAILYSGTVDIQFFSENIDMDALSETLKQPMLGFISGFLTFLVFVSVLGTAGLTPNMLVKGRAEYYLAQPLSRTELLLNKFLGIWIVYGSVIALCGLVAYGALAMVHGSLGIGIIYLFISHLVSFLVWLSISFAVGVLSGSQALSIVMVFVVWFAWKMEPMLKMLGEVMSSDLLTKVTDAIYFVLPENSALIDIGLRLSSGRSVASWVPLYTALGFSVVLIFVAMRIVKRKDF